ncbi:MAG: hypothetical protein ACLFSI_01930 [Halorhodospira sp.]
MSRARQQGVALLALTGLLAGVALLAWSVAAPTALQLRGAGMLACRSASVHAAEQAAAEAVEALRTDASAGISEVGAGRFLRGSEQGPACDPAVSCYRVEHYAEAGLFRVRARGPACGGERTAWLEVVGRIASRQDGRDEIEIRWQRKHQAER